MLCTLLYVTFLALAVFKFKLIVALPWIEAPQTKNVDVLQNVPGWTPKPTEAPFIPKVPLKRQQSPPFPTVCGYISGQEISPITCATGFCGYQSALNAVGCCLSYYVSTGITTYDQCNYNTACYGSNAACTGLCASDTMNLLCTASTASICFFYTYTDIGSWIWGCTTAFTQISIGLSAKLGSSTSFPTFTSSQATQSNGAQSIPLWETTTISPPSSTSLPTGQATLAAPTSTADESTPNSLWSHVGTITAGVVGTVAGLLVIVGIGLYFCLRIRKSGSQPSVSARTPIQQHSIPRKAVLPGSSTLPLGPEFS